MDYLCHTCSDKLMNFGYPCHQLYKIILTLHLDDSGILFDSKLDSSIKNVINFLENKHLVISTECSDRNIIVRLNTKTIHFHEDEFMFCFCQTKDHFFNDLVKINRNF